jgi:hypothetical protein
MSNMDLSFAIIKVKGQSGVRRESQVLVSDRFVTKPFGDVMRSIRAGHERS